MNFNAWSYGSYLPTLPVFLGISKFFIKSPSLPVRAPNLPGNSHCGLCQILSLILLFSRCQKENKQEVDLVLLFELFKIGKRKTEQCNQINISLTSIVIGQKSTNQIA